jgi:cytoskeletal protein CcmA (bactofilin family)
MGAIDNLNASEFPDIFRRLRALETATPLSNASIGSGGIRVHSGGMITIENGGLRVTGTAEIIGALIASGTIDFTGNVTISGPLTIEGTTDITGDTTVAGTLTTSGPLHVNGTTDISGDLDVDGTLDINGVATLNNDLNVQGGGKIVAGAITLDPASLGGKLGFSNGTYVAATPNGAQLAQGDSAVFVSASQAGIARAGVGFFVDGTSPVFTGLPTTSEPANLHVSLTTGRVSLSTA